jgi:hypothetical protein
MAAHKGPASLRPRCTRSGSSVAAIPGYLLALSCPSVRLSVSIKAAPTARISVKFVSGDFYKKKLEKIKISLKSGKNIEQFALRSKYVLLLPVTLSHH